MGHNKFSSWSINHIYRNSIQMPYAYKTVHGLGRKCGGTDSSARSLTIPNAPSTPWLTGFFFPFQRLNLGPHACWPSLLPLSYISQWWPSLLHVAFMFQFFIVITYNKCALDCFMGRHPEFFKIISGNIWKISGEFAPLA